MSPDELIWRYLGYWNPLPRIPGLSVLRAPRKVGFLSGPGEDIMRRLLRRLQPRAAIISAFGLCGLYFVSWYLISHYLTAGLAGF